MALLLCLVSALLLQQSFQVETSKFFLQILSQAITPPIRPRPTSPGGTTSIPNKEEALHTGEQGVTMTSGRGVYSSVYSYIHIYKKKLPFLADFIKKKLGPFYKKNSDVISLVIDQSQPKMH